MGFLKIVVFRYVDVNSIMNYTLSVSEFIHKLGTISKNVHDKVKSGKFGYGLLS